ncbi:MAG: hypothetical protein U0175_38660 [Caldilineaceae bacterium]
MQVSTLTYKLTAGYIHNWLVAGPFATPVVDLERFSGADFKTQIAKAYYPGDSAMTDAPAERNTLQVGSGDKQESFPWLAVQCLDDHFVDLSRFYHTCHHLQSWAYSEVEAPGEQTTNFVLTTNGPADVWINGVHVHRQLHFHHQIPKSVPFTAALKAGKNQILVRFEGVAVRECPYAMALQIREPDMDDTWQVTLPTTLRLPRRQHLMQCFEAAYLTKDVYHFEDDIVLHWPADYPHRLQITVRLQTPSGRIYAEGSPTAEAGSQLNLGKAYMRPDGEYELLLMPLPQEYYEQGMKISHHIPFTIVNSKFDELGEGTYEERREQALKDAARREVNIYSEIAKIELGWWDLVKTKPFETIIASINQRADCSDFYLVGLLGLLLRYGDDPNFPPELRAKIDDCALNFKYWMDEPGNDAMCFWSENHQILFHACEVLAGQLYPDAIFSNVNQTGEWHRQKGEVWALGWMKKRAAGGFREWDSNVYFEHDVLALTHLATLAANDEVAEMAAIILDKLFYTMGLNSFKGVFGSTHGRSYTEYLKGGRQELTSGISRLLWGQGCFNEHILGTVSLACSNYEPPAILQQIGGSLYEEVWSREQHAGVMEQRCDLADGEWSINKVTYKTPDFMLCSAQDYNPGKPGYQQHIWQATLGADAVVFTSHPPCVSEEGSHRPNFWHGNVILPRAAQWKDLLIVAYQLPEDDWMGFTHAYFPQAAFDETRINDVWAFARKGEGYLALTAAQGIRQIKQGNNAYRELRSYGSNNLWICQMGRAAGDGSFEEFQRKVTALPIRFVGASVQLQSLRQQTVEFGWTGDLRIDGQVQPLSGFKHYESPFSTCELNAEVMEIQFFDQGMRLNFQA